MMGICAQRSRQAALCPHRRHQPTNTVHHRQSKRWTQGVTCVCSRSNAHLNLRAPARLAFPSAARRMRSLACPRCRFAPSSAIPTSAARWVDALRSAGPRPGGRDHSMAQQRISRTFSRTISPCNRNIPGTSQDLQFPLGLRSRVRGGSGSEVRCARAGRKACRHRRDVATRDTAG